MKTLVTVALLAFTALPAQAQTTSGAAAQSNNIAVQTSSSGAIAGGGSVIFPEQPARTTVRNEGSTTARIESAPSLGGLAVGGGHPCAWTPGSAQFSIIGGGGGAAKMDIDEACMLAVMAAASGSHRMQNAALEIMASRDNQACKAMRSQGLISSASLCGEKPPKPVQRASLPPLEVECVRQNGSIVPNVKRSVYEAYGRDAVMKACAK